MAAEILFKAYEDNVATRIKIAALEQKIVDLNSFRDQLARDKPFSQIIGSIEPEGQSVEAQFAAIRLALLRERTGEPSPSVRPEEYRMRIQQLLNVEILPNLNVKNFPAHLSAAVSGLVKAEKHGLTKLTEAGESVAIILDTVVEDRIGELRDEMYRVYKDAIEEEPHEINRRISFFDALQSYEQQLKHESDVRLLRYLGLLPTDEERRTKGKDPESGEPTKSDDMRSEMTDAERVLARELDVGTVNEAAPPALADIGVIEGGLQVAGEHEAHPLAMMWGKRIEELKKAAIDPANKDHRAEIEEQLNLSRNILDHLSRTDRANPLHPEHVHAVNEAATLMEKIAEHARSTLEGGEHGRGLADRASEQRGRLTSLTMLLKELLPKLLGHGIINL